MQEVATAAGHVNLLGHIHIVTLHTDPLQKFAYDPIQKNVATAVWP